MPTSAPSSAIWASSRPLRSTKACPASSAGIATIMATPEPCAACRGPLRPVARRRGTAIRRCAACGLVMGEMAQQPPSDDVVATAPSHFTLLRDQYGRHREVSEALLERRLAVYERHLGGPPRHWLEIGPGNGVLSDLLAGRGCTWLGVEFDEAMAAAMRAEGKNVVQADFSTVVPETLMDETVRANGG